MLPLKPAHEETPCFLVPSSCCQHLLAFAGFQWQRLSLRLYHHVAFSPHVPMSLCLFSEEHQSCWIKGPPYSFFPCDSVVKNPSARQEMQETPVWSLGPEEPLEEEMATHSSILARKVAWTEEPGGLQSLGLQRVGRGWAGEHATPVWLHLSLSHHIRKQPCFQQGHLRRSWGLGLQISFFRGDAIQALTTEHKEVKVVQIRQRQACI